MSAPNDPTPEPLPLDSADTMRLAPEALPVSEPALAFPAASAPVKQVIGDYEIVGKLGQGGMGTVYRARQVSLGRFVALKILPATWDGDAEFVGRFQREARLAASLNHPNLVGVYKSGFSDGCHYIAMELIEGETLAQRLKGGALPPAEALRICRGVARALQCGWQNGQLIHRDIKPSNIYLSHRGEVKLGDLGLAKSLATNTTGLTHTGTAMGTPHYISPEQARGEKGLDFRADIYSLGCTLYESLTGRTPYEGNDPLTVMSLHLNAPPPAILGVMPQCPIPLGRLVSRMLKKSRHERPASYEELIAAMESVGAHLEAVAAGPAASAPPVVAAHAVDTPLRNTPVPLPVLKRSKTPLHAGIAAGGLVLALAAWLIFGPKENALSESERAAKEREARAGQGKGAALASTKSTPSTGTAPPAPAPATGMSPLLAPLLAKATKDAPFVNTLGQEFVPVPGTQVLFCRWETRVKDWAVYALANKAAAKAGGEPGHPVVNVSWEDANAFCDWLTEKESAEGKLPKGMMYRLPADDEWSRAVGLAKETGATPKERSGKNGEDFPWGKDWPPKAKVGNYADESFHEKFTKETDKWIEGYTDGFATTAPVGSFPPNELGIYDLGGNAREWCEDLSEPAGTSRVVRGASRGIRTRGMLLSSYRDNDAPTNRSDRNGFRVVVGGASAP